MWQAEEFHKIIILCRTRELPYGSSVFCGFSTQVTLLPITFLLQEVASMVCILATDMITNPMLNLAWHDLHSSYDYITVNSLAVHYLYCHFKNSSRTTVIQKVITCVWYSYTKYTCSLCTECCQNTIAKDTCTCIQVNMIHSTSMWM